MYMYTGREGRARAPRLHLARVFLFCQRRQRGFLLEGMYAGIVGESSIPLKNIGRPPRAADRVGDESAIVCAAIPSASAAILDGIYTHTKSERAPGPWVPGGGPASRPPAPTAPAACLNSSGHRRLIAPLAAALPSRRAVSFFSFHGEPRPLQGRGSNTGACPKYKGGRVKPVYFEASPFFLGDLSAPG